MKKIFDSGVLHLLPTADGFIFVAFQGEYADRAIVVYRKYDAATGTIEPITRNVYLLSKFGNGFEQFESSPSEFLNTRTEALHDHRTLVLHPSGEASVLNINGVQCWSGKMLYRGHGPSSAAMTDKGLWVSYPAGNAIVRYSLRNMREDLRVGSEHSDVLKSPEYLFRAATGKMLVCTGENRKILSVNLDSYVIDEYMSFNEPVRQYTRIGHDEVVLLDSGIYML